MFNWLKKLLLSTQSEDHHLDDPRTTILRKGILRDNRFLRKLYEEWYRSIIQSLPDTPGFVVELGSGAGFMKERIPGLITTDILVIPDISISMNAQQMPFAGRTLRAVVMVNVLHHLPDPRLFFNEVARCLKTGGVLVMIEPWRSFWSGLIYRYLHHEPFDTESEEWGFPQSGPLSGANGAMPWNIFGRDIDKFNKEFAQLELRGLELLAPFRYLLSGGMSVRSLAPSWSFGFFRGFENMLKPLFAYLAMFARIEIVKTGD